MFVTLRELRQIKQDTNTPIEHAATLSHKGSFRKDHVPKDKKEKANSFDYQIRNLR